MDKMLVAVFETRSAAFEGLNALKDLHRDGDITLYAWAVIVKDKTGKIEHQAGPRGAGPRRRRTRPCSRAADRHSGWAGGTRYRRLSWRLYGFMCDLDNEQDRPDVLDEVAQDLTAGKAAVMAEVEESWTTRIDQRLRKHGGMVFRRLPAESSTISSVAESAAFEADLKALEKLSKRSPRTGPRSRRTSSR